MIVATPPPPLLSSWICWWSHTWKLSWACSWKTFLSCGEKINIYILAKEIHFCEQMCIFLSEGTLCCNLYAFLGVEKNWTETRLCKCAVFLAGVKAPLWKYDWLKNTKWDPKICSAMVLVYALALLLRHSPLDQCRHKWTIREPISNKSTHVLSLAGTVPHSSGEKVEVAGMLWDQKYIFQF